MTTKKEMARLIEQMADTPEATQWLRERNEAMRRSLRDISLSAVQYDAVGGRSGHGDSTADKVLKRAETEERIRTNERAIRDRLRLHSDLSLVMAEALTTEERTNHLGEACGAPGMGSGGAKGETFQNCLLSEGGGGDGEALQGLG